MAHKINMTFDCLTLRQPIIASIINKCVEATLKAEGITPTCEINVLVTNDRGIQAINLASRNIDKATDVLSFPAAEGETLLSIPDAFPRHNDHLYR